MERFSCERKIEITFDIISAPSNIEGTKVIADIEGSFSLSIDGELLLEEEDILLLELAFFLSKWLKDIENNNVRNFYYESMNYEEKPILEFVKIKKECWKLGSIWQKFENKYCIGLNEFSKTAKNYIQELEYDLKYKFNLDISVFIS